MAANIAGLNNSFIRAEQFVHQAIANKSKETMSIWRDMIDSIFRVWSWIHDEKT